MKTLWRKTHEKVFGFIKRIRDSRSSAKRNRRNHRTVSVESTYNATCDDFYIGVVSEKASTIHLPTTVGDGKIIIIKSEMTPPLGNRKITIVTDDGSKIDGSSSYTIQVSHEVIRLIRHNNSWHVI